MNGVLVEIRHNYRDSQRNLGLDKATRDALADYCRARSPSGTAKWAAREWDLTTDEGRGVVAGRASQTTIDKIIKHRNGGWSVLLPVMGQVIGQTVDQYVAQKRASHEEQGQRLAAVAGSLWAVPSDRHRSDTDTSRSLDRMGRTVGDRSAGRAR